MPVSHLITLKLAWAAGAAATKASAAAARAIFIFIADTPIWIVSRIRTMQARWVMRQVETCRPSLVAGYRRKVRRDSTARYARYKVVGETAACVARLTNANDQAAGALFSSPFHPHVFSSSCICAGTGAATLIGA